MRFGPDYSEVWEDRSGRPYLLRLVQPADRSRFVEGLADCSAATLYNRFMSAKTRFLDEELEYLTHPQPDRHIAIVALHEDRLVAVGRAAMFPGIDDEADLGLIVADRFQGNGLGSVLLQRLASAMKERGVAFLRGEMFSTNTRMFALAESSGFPVKTLIVGPVAHIAIDIGDADGS